MATQKEAVVTHAASTGTVATRRLGLLSIVLLGLTVVLGLFVSDEDVIQGSTVRIMYVHVPLFGLRTWRLRSLQCVRPSISAVRTDRSHGTE